MHDSKCSKDLCATSTDVHILLGARQLRLAGCRHNLTWLVPESTKGTCKGSGKATLVATKHWETTPRTPSEARFTSLYSSVPVVKARKGDFSRVVFDLAVPEQRPCRASAVARFTSGTAPPMPPATGEAPVVLYVLDSRVLLERAGEGQPCSWNQRSERKQSRFSRAEPSRPTNVRCALAAHKENELGNARVLIPLRCLAS